MKSSTYPTSNNGKRSGHPKIWILTNGRMGDLVQCRAIAEGLDGDISEITVHDSLPYRWLMPYGPMDPRDRAHLQKPFPDIVIASGRRTVPLARAIHKASSAKRGTSFAKILFMKHPGRNVSDFALTWLPEHDGRSGADIITTLTTPHGLSETVLAEKRQNPHPDIAKLPEPRLAIILGGNSKHVTYDAATIADFTEPLKTLTTIKSVMITGSRRTPSALLNATIAATANLPQFVADPNNGEANLYAEILAHADALLVTGDSHNMVSEALAAGRLVHVYNPPQNAKKFNWALAEMAKRGLIKLYPGPIEPGTQLPFDATEEIIAKVKTRFSL